MDLTTPVVQYCERLGPGLFAEPLNALSNLAFLLAGAWLLLILRGQAQAPWYTRALAGLIVLIGLCSLSFHTFANTGTEKLDVLSIALYIFFFVACFFRHFFGAAWFYAVLAIPGYMAFSWIVTEPFAPGALNGSVGYLPALAGMALMAAYLLFKKPEAARYLGGGALVFMVSLYLRTEDRAWCAHWPIGTHWAWHCLNALTLTLVTLSLVRAGPARAPAALPGE